MGVAELGCAASWHRPQGAAVRVPSVILIGLFVIKERVGTLSPSTPQASARSPAQSASRDSAQMQYLCVKRVSC